MHKCTTVTLHILLVLYFRQCERTKHCGVFIVLVHVQRECVGHSLDLARQDFDWPWNIGTTKN